MSEEFKNLINPATAMAQAANTDVQSDVYTPVNHDVASPAIDILQLQRMRAEEIRRDTARSELQQQVLNLR